MRDLQNSFIPFQRNSQTQWQAENGMNFTFNVKAMG